MTDFPGITKQARMIARLYKFLGLWSIPILTIVTIISISNMFSRGQLASSPLLDVIWIAVFAAAIEVNIVRLFFEWKLEHDRGALWLGIGLVFVAGVALLMEGLQQSIGFAWSNFYVQWVVGAVVGLRVFVVIMLLAREGSRLASAMVDTTQPLYACLVQFDAPIDTTEQSELIQEDVPDSEQPLRFPEQSSVPKKRIVTPAQLRRMRSLVNTDPHIPIRTLADKVGVSPNTAQKYKSRIEQEA